MSRFHSYLRTAGQLLAAYDGSLPFAPFAKAFFAREKKYGSTDRRQISAICYHYFRAAKAFGEIAEEEKLLAATFLCENKHSLLLAQLRPEWNEAIHLPVKEKIARLPFPFSEKGLFPFANALSAEIEKPVFAFSLLVQPHLYLRLRPGCRETVLQKLAAANIPVTAMNATCIALPNGTKVEDIIRLDKETVVQDYSSQQTGTVVQETALQHLPTIKCWDCCAASGGKSLLLHDLRPDAYLIVSDVRPTILHNLRQRFQQASIGHYQSMVADVAAKSFQLPGSQTFNLIVADVPCTGSGTWARTPEQLCFFKEERIQEYAARQQKIVRNVLPYLQNEGYLVYITCSVFEAENEAIVLPLAEAFGLQLLTMQYLKGYTCRADTLFIAVLQKQ